MSNNVSEVAINHPPTMTIFIGGYTWYVYHSQSWEDCYFYIFYPHWIMFSDKLMPRLKVAQCGRHIHPPHRAQIFDSMREAATVIGASSGAHKCVAPWWLKVYFVVKPQKHQTTMENHQFEQLNRHKTT